MDAIDLFSGCGGMSMGFDRAGFRIVKAVEFDPVIANTYKKNNPSVDLFIDDIKNVVRSNVFSKGEAEVIIGGPPCQGFSMAGARIRQGFIDDPRNYLFKHYFSIVKVVKPKVFVMENVKGIATMQQGKIFKEIHRLFESKELLDGQQYHLYHKLINAADFGVPQKRERMIIIGCLDSEIDFEGLWSLTKSQITKDIPTYFDSVNIKEAIGNLPQTTVDGLVDNPSPANAYQAFLSSKTNKICNHTQSRHSKIAVDRMKQIKPGENYTVLKEKINSVHSGSYGRMCWDELSTTITTRFDTPAGGRFIHPQENRTLSPREAARLQSFPDSYTFYGDKRSISRQIGNAVPPKVSYFLACLIKNILTN